jgi:rhodanese-related sulfurtransferase
LQQIDSGDDVICYCHHGMRSLDVANWLRSQGVSSAKSMTGGIDRWSAEIDPKVPRY